MEMLMHHPKMLFLLCLLLHSFYFATSQPFIGVAYGRLSRMQADPMGLAKLLNSSYIKKVRMLTGDPTDLIDLETVDVSVMVGQANNDELHAMATQPDYCSSWLRNGILRYNATKQIHMIVVGNKVLGSGKKNDMDNLVPAMQNMQKAVDAAGLHGKIKISTVHSLDVLSISDPPSSASFNPEYFSALKPLLEFLKENDSPFMISTFPYYDYLENPTPQMLAYCLFQPNAGQVDPGNGLKYMNMFDTKVDAIRNAVNGLEAQDMEIVVAETGWPSNGDDNEIGADLATARTYNANLVHHLRSMVGTPLVPHKSVDTYIYTLFDEDFRDGPTSIKSFGILHYDLTWKYDLYLSKTTHPYH